MGKGQKTSASSATRKKHAKKAGGGEQLLPLPKEKKDKSGKKGKGKHAEPRQKIFIPPSKPAPVRPDPLMNTGIATRLPADLLVILRRLAKKAPTTRQKALEELNASWLARPTSETEATLVVALPVWIHHAPTLFLSASRRLRALAAQTHFAWLRMERPRTRIVQLLRGEAPPSQIAALLGAWRMAAEDIDKLVSSAARRSWDLLFRKLPVPGAEEESELSIVLDAETLDPLLEFVQRALLDPPDIYTELNPIQPAAEPVLPPHAARHKGGAKAPARQTRVVEEDESTRQSEEDEERVEDRDGRLRVGALGALRWVIELGKLDTEKATGELLSLPLLWTGLYHGSTPPFCKRFQTASGPLGKEQPSVRKATWSILHSLLNKSGGEINSDLLPVVSSAVLRSAWTEPDPGVRAGMWEPLLRFLIKNPRAWEVDLGNSTIEDHDEDGSDDDSDDDDSGSDADQEHSNHPSALHAPQSEAYREFLQFLQLGCYGSPSQGYPSAIIVLSTIPPSIMGLDPSSWEDLLSSFWAAFDGRALSRSTDATLFLNSLLECIIFLVRRSRARSDATNGDERENFNAGDYSAAVETTVVLQIERIWSEVASNRLGAEDAAGTALSNALIKLLSIDSTLWQAAWAKICDAVETACAVDDKQEGNKEALLARQLSLVKTLYVRAVASADSEQGKALIQATEDLSRTIARSFTNQLLEALAAGKSNADKSKSSTQILTEVLKSFADVIFNDPGLANNIDDLFHSHLPAMLDCGVGLVLAYVMNRGEQAASSSLSIWQATLKVIATNPDLLLKTMPELLGAAEAGLLPSFLQLSHGDREDELENAISVLLDEALASLDQHGQRLEIVRRLLQHPGHFLFNEASSKLFVKTVQVFSDNVQLLIFAHTSSSDVETNDIEDNVKKLHVPLWLVSSTLRVRPEALRVSQLQPLIPSFFAVGFLLPSIATDHTAINDTAAQARAIWQIAMQLPDTVELLSSARVFSKGLISNVASRIPTDAVLQRTAEGHLGLTDSSSVISEFFPPQEVLDDMLHGLPRDPIDPALSVIDPLVPPQSLFSHMSTQGVPSYDSQGCSEYSRIICALLKVVTGDRSLLHTRLWLLYHFIALAHAAADRRMVRAAKSAFFMPEASEDMLLSIEKDANTLTSFGLVDIGATTSDWHTEIVRAHSTRSPLKIDKGGLAAFVLHVLGAAQKDDAIRDGRVLRTVLRHILNSAEANDAEKWVSLSRKIEKQSPNTAMAIINAVAQSGLEPPSLDRLRNELAAGALGVRPSKARVDGLVLLHRISVAVPNHDSDAAFLPQNRAVNFVKACQTWLSAEDDENDSDTGIELEIKMSHVFQHLAPVLQLVLGAHWDLFFDLIEENLEYCSFDDSGSLPLLARTLELVNIIRELARSNRNLREDWSSRERTILGLIKKCVQEAKVDSQAPTSAPRAVCGDLALGIMQDLPQSLIDNETLAQVVHLLLDPTPDAAFMSYTIIRRAAKALTEHLVVEAGVDTSDEGMKFELSPELLAVLRSAEPGNDNAEFNVLTYLLSWMTVFDLFEDASLRLKMAYGNQLRELGLIESGFLPVMFELLDVGTGSKPFPLELWSVDQYFIEYYDPELPLSTRLLAAHLMYRALIHVPSLVTAWWTNCKDRQFSAAFRTLITRHYSPLLITSEYSHLRESNLSEGEWTVRIAQNTGEVNISYAVDDQSLEICIDIPSDYPLHSVKVRELRRLGVDDKRWRAWLLAVQQVITSQNGRVADGITLFKKNVSSHFEDQTECAICYSLISVTEYTLPKKRCKTCKNRFHAGCLFKWFSTSHTSSCPLCRSDFI